MTAAIKVVTYDPEWEPPDSDELKEYGVDKGFMDKVETFHTGLKSLSFKGVWKNEDGASMTQPVCSFKIRGGGTNKIPGIKPDLLASLIVARATEHAEHVGEIVNYKVTFYGDNDDLGGAFQKQGSFKIDGRPEDEEDEEEEEEEEPSTQIRRGPGVRVLPTAAGPAMLRTPEPESEAVKLFKVLQQWSAGLFAELRASMAQQRIDMTASMQAQREDYRHILGDMGALMSEVRSDLQHSRDEVNKANQRIVKMSEQTASHFRGQQEANKQGWEAFRAGMQMQLQAMSQSMSWERQVMFMQFDNLAQQKRKEERPKWVKDYGPLIIAAVGQVMSSKGSPMGEKIQELAMSAMEDDEEEEDEDEDEAPTPANPTVMGVPDGVSAKDHFEKNQLSSMLQLLKSMLTPEQHKKLKELLPNMAYSTLQTALRSTNDMLAKAYVIQFMAHVQGVPGLDDKLTGELSDEQRELFNDIALLVTESMPGKKKPAPKNPVIDVEATPTPKSAPQPPPAPPAPPPPPGAPGASGGAVPPYDPQWRVEKLKAYAKKHYGLSTWPRGTKKKDIIEAIKAAAKEKKK
jgi:hypothetical protein